ncbi:hypothetical protein ACLQ2N_30975 [Streptomyces sp. DT224]|uniref:hypothetical protein n=1 Tax=Streptomyces sp. DT224 TaxID=3393426 RepID=UPI003CFA8CE7
MPDPVPGPGELLVEGLRAGGCGTDKEIAAGDHGWAPSGEDRLITGHEPLPGCARRTRGAAWTASYGIVCLTGVSPKGCRRSVDAGTLNRALVLENDAVVGSVNADPRHYRAGAEALRRTDPDWLERMITRRVPLRDADAFTAQDGDIKVVIGLG